MSSSGTGSNLTQAARELLLEWQRTKSDWHDVKSQDFEQTYIEPLPGHVDRTAKVMAEIEQTLKKIRSDCE
ncbi:MAG TPA: hypothetical protein VGZ93_07560 [Candidatus Methylacidiphilales bacterium]|jgi:hypothetical protein|nr:hypothetical protein [Candidatus Methylacidiphilales bacterium]